MSSSGSDHEEDSILNNLNKTRQLWSSKADLGTADYLIPKSPIPVVKPTPRRSTSSSSNQHDVEPKTPVDVVRADEQVVEDYELPDIKSMRSQWEVQNQQSYPVPSPSQKAPAVLAREKSVKRQLLQENIVPVNREETEEDENYAVELGKLKAQFENANKKSSNANTQPVAKSAVSKSAIKESVS
uniref:Uncharacterized protein n=1 Tax=Ciona savignyi TaxID=51511 RepID=H2Z436_CIOSA